MDDENLTKKQRRDIKRQQKLENRNKEARSAKRNKILTFVIIMVAVVFVGAIIVMAGNNDGNGDNVTNDFADPTLGPPDVKVVVEEFSDFQCPACASAEQTVMDMIDQYGDQIKFVYNDLPLISIHSNAKNAAIAGQCALAQDNFWDLHDLLFDRQASWDNKSRDEAIELFKEYAGEAGLDQAQFDTCLDNKDTEDAVDEDMNQARSRNISSTPTFFINDERVVGEADLIAEVEKVLAI